MSEPAPRRGSRKVVPLHGDGGDTAAPRERRRASSHWLGDHVRDLVAGVDTAIDDLTLMAQRQVPAPPAATMPPPPAADAAAPAAVPAAAESPADPVRGGDTLARVRIASSLPTPVSALRHLHLETTRIPDPHMRVRHVAVAAVQHMGWRDRLRHLLVAVADPASAPAAAVTETPPPLVWPVAATAPWGLSDPAADLAPGPVLDIAQTEVPPAAEVVAPAPEIVAAAPALVAMTTAVVEAPPLTEPAEAAPATGDDADDDQWDPHSLPPLGGPGMLSRLLGYLTAAAVSVAMIVCLAIASTVLTGHKLETVVSSSMEPNIPKGSMVVAEKVPVDSLRPGDVLIFQRPANPNIENQRPEVIVHRIVPYVDPVTGKVGPYLDPGDGTLGFATKGDANTANDCWVPPNCPVTRDAHALADRAVYVLPGFGNLAVVLQTGAILFVAVILIAMVLGWGVRQIRRQLSAI